MRKSNKKELLQICNGFISETKKTGVFESVSLNDFFDCVSFSVVENRDIIENPENLVWDSFILRNVISKMLSTENLKEGEKEKIILEACSYFVDTGHIKTDDIFMCFLLSRKQEKEDFRTIKKCDIDFWIAVKKTLPKIHDFRSELMLFSV